MKWRKVALKTKTEAIDFISALFDELGFEGIQIEDHVPLSEEDKEKMFIDIVPDMGPDDGTAVITSYVDMGRDTKELEQLIQEGLDELEHFVDLGERKLTMETTDEEDWINNWKQFFKPFRVTKDIIIKPTWEQLKEKKAGDLVIEIDPGTAFGTGSHETTKLCIGAMEEYVNQSTKVLDIGCGSGILSIIALELGAAKAVGTDIDPNACRVAVENAKVNQLDMGKYTIFHGDVIQDQDFQQKVRQEQYDVVMANILADVIIPLSGVVGQFMKEDGIFISSGIIDIKKEEVEEALKKNGFEIVKTSQMGDWYSFTAKIRK